MSARSLAAAIVSNGIALVVVALLAGVAIDYVAVWMGYRPPLGCTLLAVVQTVSMTACVVLTFVGAVLYLVGSMIKGPTLFFGGLFIGILPTLLNAYLVRLFGVGCGG